MRFQVRSKGTGGLLMHNGAAGLDTRSPANLEKAEISRKRGSNRTASDDARLAELECQVSLWLDESGAPPIPASAIRSCIETGARKVKQGPQVREGLIVESIDAFDYNRERLGSTIEELGRQAQFTVPVVVQRSRVLRTRAQFRPWALTFTVEVDDELVDQSQLGAWLDIAGRRIGLGDWRPEKSGSFGRFAIESITPIEKAAR